MVSGDWTCISHKMSLTVIGHGSVFSEKSVTLLGIIILQYRDCLSLHDMEFAKPLLFMQGLSRFW